MALSQIQCLDDNHVNPRTHESKPEFFYCEDQRLALETLLRDGREAFVKYLEARGVRGFLSDPEMESLCGATEPYDPGRELFPESAEGETPVPLSLHYWPDLSDTSIPQMDLGWPDSEAYRGVTRTTVYTQPPMEGQVHIKEVVRKMIAQAQKVIAVVMDVFTDVDIFRDLLDVGFKKKVSVYVLLESTNLPHFLSMCRRADMHTGHLKHLRVRCTAGTEFYTRSCTKVKGRMGHRFMFIDGDKAVSGSYSFTWMSSRLDRNLITVTTGQAVDGFDRLFRVLYASSDSVDLRKCATGVEPEPEPVRQPVVLAPPSAAIARKLYNPKYALVAATNPSPNTSVGRESPKEEPALEDPKKKRRRRASEEDALPLHPGLVDLEKAYLIPYLPTWPEPDPPSDVIGFINTRDVNKPIQVHLQRSEMFESSQAIRFSSPFSKTEETAVVAPRKLNVRSEEIQKPQAAQNKIIVKESETGKTENKATERSADKVEPAQLSVTKEKAPQTILPDSISALDNKRSPITASNQVRSNETPHLSAHTGLQTSSKTAGPNKATASNINRNRPQSDLFPESSSSKKAEAASGLEGVAAYRAHTLESNDKQASQLPADTNRKVDSPKKTAVSHTDSLAQQERVTSSTSAARSFFHFESNHIPLATTSTSTSSPSSPSTPSFKSPVLTSPSSSTSPFPVPKPRTVQLLIKDTSTDSQVCLVKKAEPSTPPTVRNEPAASPGKETVKERQDSDKAAARTHADLTRHPEETAHHRESLTFKEANAKEAEGPRESKVRTQSSTENNKLDITSNTLTNVLKSHEMVPKYINPKTVISTDCDLKPKTESDSGSAEKTSGKLQEITSPESAKKAENLTKFKTHLAKAHEPQKISYYRLTPQDIGIFDSTDSSKDPLRSLYPSKDRNSSNTLAFAADHLSEPSKKAVSGNNKDSVLNSSPQNTLQEVTPKTGGASHTPEKSLHLQLSDKHAPGLRTLTPERELRPIASPARTPTPTDRFPPRSLTPDSRTSTPDSRSYTPDFRTPTPDISDGYVSPREDSNLSTTSEEYYECNDSPVFDRTLSQNHGTMKDNVMPSVANTTIPSTDSPYLSSSLGAGTGDRSALLGDTQILPTRERSSSFQRAKMEKPDVNAKEENGKEEKEKVRKLGEAARRDREEAGRTEHHHTQEDHTPKTAEKDATLPKRPLSQSAADRPVIRGTAAGESPNEETGLTPLSGGSVLKPERVTSEGEKPDKVPPGRETLTNQVALRSRAVVRRETAQSSKETEEPKRVQQQQQDGGSPFSSRPPRPPRPLSGSQYMGARPWASRQLNQTESKVLEVLEGSSSPRRAPYRPPPPAAPAARRPLSQSQQAAASRQPAAAQGRTRALQTQSPTSPQKPQASFLQSQLHPPPQSQSASVQEAQDDRKAPFSLNFSKLVSLKSLKDRINNMPPQSRKSSSSTPVEGRKSTS